MAFDSSRFGLGINWLQRLTEADHDQGRGPLVPEPDLPPMFRPDRGVHKTMNTTVGELAVGERFWHQDHEYEVMRNSGARYVQATGITKQANIYLEQDQEVEVRDGDSSQ